jgi:hypothetical protein
MLDPDRRKKMISLRLSEEEYKLLKARYHTYGARNVSDLARQALHQMMTGPAGPQDGFARKLADLDERVQALESRIAAHSAAAAGKS